MHVRLILDTNLWSSVGREGSVEHLNNLMAQQRAVLIMPPSILVEVLKTPVAATRDSIIQAMTTGRRQRLPSEAQSESDEFVSAVRAARPQWLRRMPDTARVASLNSFWTKRVWQNSLVASDRLHDFQVARKPIIDHLVQQQRDQRSEVLRLSFNVDPLTEITASADSGAPIDYLGGWDGGPVEAWRISNRDLFWEQLVTEPRRALLSPRDTTYADWVGAYVDLRALAADKADFTRLWLYEVELSVTPRSWLRWAINFAQTSMKVTEGNPSDEQHGAYLLDADLLLTADKRFVEAIKLVRKSCPFVIAEPLWVDRHGGKASVVDDILETLAEHEHDSKRQVQ